MTERMTTKKTEPSTGMLETSRWQSPTATDNQAPARIIIPNLGFHAPCPSRAYAVGPITLLETDHAIHHPNHFLQSPGPAVRSAQGHRHVELPAMSDRRPHQGQTQPHPGGVTRRRLTLTSHDTPKPVRSAGLYLAWRRSWAVLLNRPNWTTPCSAITSR